MSTVQQMESDSASSIPFSLPEPTPEGEYESRIANLDTAPTQCTTEYFSWRQLTDLSAKIPELVEQFGTVTASYMSDYVMLGTENGAIVITDYLGRVKAVLGSQSTAAYGSVSALAFSTDFLAIAAGYSQGYVVVWDWTKGTTISVSRPAQPGDKPNTAGHPAGNAVTFVGFIGKSKHRYVSGSAGGHVLYHHIVRRLLTTMSTTRLAGPDGSSNVLFEVAALPCGSYPCPLDDIGLVAVLTSAHLTVIKTNNGVEQQFRLSYLQQQQQQQQSPLVGAATLKRKFSKRPYSGSVAWLPALKHKRPATETDPTESEFALPMLAFSWGPNIYVLLIQPDYKVADNGAPLSSTPSRVKFEREFVWAAIEDVVFCRWIDTDVLLYMTQSQRMFVLEIELNQETEICKSPPSSIAGRPWTTLATGIEAEPSYTQVISVYKQRVFTMCDTPSVYTGRLLTWAERLAILVDQGDLIDSITLALDFYQARTGQVVVGLPRSRRVGDKSTKKKQSIVGSRLIGLMRSALKHEFSEDSRQELNDAVARALASVCVEACLAINNEQFLFNDVFDYYATVPAKLRVFLETIEPFIVSGQIESLPPQILNAIVDNYAITPQLVRRLGEILMSLSLSPGEFDVDLVLNTCRQHHLWRTFARVWLSMGDPIAPITNILAAAMATKSEKVDFATGHDEVGEPQETAGSNSSRLMFSEEAAEAVIFDYLDMVVRGRHYPDGKAILPQTRAEKYSTLITELIFPPTNSAQQLPTDVKNMFSTLLALAELNTERFLLMLKHVLDDPFMDYINIIVKPTASAHPNVSERSLRRASQVKSFLQIVVDTLFILTKAANSGNSDILTKQQIGLLSSFALTLYTSRFPLVFLKDETVVEWTNILLNLDDASTRTEREYAFELLFRLNPPQSYSDYIDRVRNAGFFRALEHMYRSLDQYEMALRTYLDHPDYAYHRAVFPALKELATANNYTGALSGVVAFAKNNARELVDTDAESFADAIESVSKLEHGVIIDILGDFPQSQFAYLRALLDPTPDALSRSPRLQTRLSASSLIATSDERLPPNIGLSEEHHFVVYPFLSLIPDDRENSSRYPQKYHERYLELLCQHSPGNVLRYLKRNADLSPEPFRLSYVQSICDKYKIGDGLVWALVRLGDFSGALQTLLEQTDKEVDTIRVIVPVSISDAASPLSGDPNAQLLESSVLSEVDRERLVDHLDTAARNITDCVDVCKSALTRLGKDVSVPPAHYLEYSTDVDDNTGASKLQNNYRSMVSAQLCDLWLDLLRRTLGYLHSTNRTLGSLSLTVPASIHEAWQLISKRQRWMLQEVLDALIFAASPASSFISLRSIIQQLIASGAAANDMPRPASAARSLDIAEMQHLLGVAVGAYKSEAQLMVLTNVLVDYDLFTTFAQLLRSQKQGWYVSAAGAKGSATSYPLSKHDPGCLCCNKCSEQLFVDCRRSHSMTNWREQMAQYFESNTLRILDLHVFEDKSAQWQWIKLRGASATYSKFASISTSTSGGSSSSASSTSRVVLFKCGHGFHQRCLAAGGRCAAKSADTTGSGRGVGNSGEQPQRQQLLECPQCIGGEQYTGDEQQHQRHKAALVVA
ncbi:Golgi CORVET complex core vacuolar protein 8-domain-containing protein [Coemansia spiralis]|nr:Golgi CORVET complex core vacuolar protein 8-domain-containing protein [Coemansia spiralis]